MFSMTGFGKGEAATADGGIIQVEISSVNRKQLEVRFSMPQEFTEFENDLRKLLSANISRGAIQFKVICRRGSAAGDLNIDEALLDKLVSVCDAARQRNNLERNVNVETLLTLPGVITTANDENKEVLKSALFQAADNALANYQSMRSSEGEILSRDLLKRLELLENMHSTLAALVSGQPEAAKKRLLAKFEAEKLPIAVDDAQLLKEVLFYIDKGDVTEELTRLSSHFEQFRNFLAAAVPVGRSLDFLAQEMFREITTLGNKAFIPGVSPVVVEFKSEMEKIREQIQNLE